MATSVGKVTVSLVRGLQPGDEVRDSELKGFGVRRQTQAACYFVHTRIKGKLKRITIGRHGSPWTPETARRQAATVLMSIRAGGDPARERDDNRAQSPTFEEVSTRFFDEYCSKLKPSTVEVYRHLVNKQLMSAFAGKQWEEIDAELVARAHARWKATPRTANHALAVLSSMVTWMQGQGVGAGQINPCTHVGRYRETQRERYLTDLELRQLGETLRAREEVGGNPYVIGLIRMLILTGARLSEMLTLRWSFVNAQKGVIRLPDSKTGAKTIQLNQGARDVLAKLPRMEKSDWVFAGHRHGQHLVNIQKPWRSIRSEAGLDDVRLHDLRHSFASVAVEMGGSLPLIGHLLGHSQPQTTARYAHVAPSPAQKVAEDTGRRIVEAMGPSAVRRPAAAEKSAGQGFRERLRLRKRTPA